MKLNVQCLAVSDNISSDSAHLGKRRVAGPRNNSKTLYIYCRSLRVCSSIYLSDERENNYNFFSFVCLFSEL